MTGIPITMVAPCRDCIHASVCSLKAVIDVEKATLSIPALQWITPRHDDILVDCSEFIDVLNIKPPAQRQTRSEHVRRPRVGLVAPPAEPAGKGHGRRSSLSDEDLAAYYADHTIAQTAEHFGCSPATVSRRMSLLAAAGGEVVRHRGPGRPATPRLAAVPDDWSPLCMSAEEWADWQRMNPRLPAAVGGQASRPCIDCPAEYAAEMRALGRCNGEPGVAA